MITTNRKLIKIENKTPNKYTTPLKSLLNIDDNVKKHISINGASQEIETKMYLNLNPYYIKIYLYIILKIYK